MERVFLRRRIGVLFCIVGILTILSAISVFFLEPAAQTSAQEKPEPWLVIDPGHGGEDGGAVAADGTPEAELNLQISLRLHALARLCGVQTAMTRQSEHIEYPTDAGTISARKTADQKQRVEMIKKAVEGIPNVYVDAFDGLTTEFMKDIGVSYLVRGIRNAADLDFEQSFAWNNKMLYPECETVFLSSAPEHLMISSTVVRELLKAGIAKGEEGRKLLAKYVPESIVPMILAGV